MTPSKEEMHRHDLDLIASLADGSLENGAEARALVETCPECRAEYEAQRAALAYLSSTPSVAPMSDIERAALHRDLWTALRSQPEPAASRSPWWSRWSYAAAGLFLLVGLVGVLGQLNESTGEQFMEVSSGLDGGGDGQERADAEDPANPLSAPDEETGATAGDAGQESEEPPVTTMAATGDTTAPEAVAFQAMAAETRESAIEGEGPTTTVAEDEDRDCLTENGLGSHRILATVERERTYLVVVPAGVELTAKTPVTILDADNCELVYSEN